MRPILSVHNATLHRGRRLVLSGVRLDLHAGERLVIAGPNGAGKSTLLAAMAGFLRPTQGRVLWDGVLDMHAYLRVVARRRALVAQHANDAPGFLVRDLIELGRIPHARRGSPVRDAEAVARAAATVGIEHLLDRATVTLSGGQRQLVHMARALAQLDPVEDSLLLLDEPTASLDPRHAQALLARARDLAARGAAVVAVLHDLTLASRFATRVLLVDEGRILADGPPAQVLTARYLEQVYQTPFSIIETPDGLGPVIAARPPVAELH